MFLLRRAAAYQAYYETMPLRAAQLPTGPNLRLYPAAAVRQPDRSERARHAAVPIESGVRSAAPRPAAPRRSIPRARFSARSRSGGSSTTSAIAQARWTVLGQQVPTVRARHGRRSTRPAASRWTSGTATRHRASGCTRACKETKAPNPIVLSGDVHVHYGADLKLDFANPKSDTVGVEFTNTSITSGGDGSDVGANWEPTRGSNPHIRYHSNRRGYIACTATPATMRADFKVLDRVTRAGSAVPQRRVAGGRSRARRRDNGLTHTSNQERRTKNEERRTKKRTKNEERRTKNEERRTRTKNASQSPAERGTRNPGTPEPRNSGTTELRNSGTQELRNSGTQEPRLGLGPLDKSVATKTRRPRRGHEEKPRSGGGRRPLERLGAAAQTPHKIGGRCLPGLHPAAPAPVSDSLRPAPPLRVFRCNFTEGPSCLSCLRGNAFRSPFSVRSMIRTGQISAFYLFDVSDSLDLTRLPGLLNVQTEPARLAPKPATPAYVRYQVAPLQIEGDALGAAEVGGFRVRVKLFDYGVVSVSLNRPFSASGRS